MLYQLSYASPICRKIGLCDACGEGTLALATPAAQNSRLAQGRHRSKPADGLLRSAAGYARVLIAKPMSEAKSGLDLDLSLGGIETNVVFARSSFI